jgi:hypothetical protein
MSKDIYLDEVERIAAELEEGGMEPGKAYDRASEMAWDEFCERLADMADDIKTRRKEGR